MQDSLVVNVTDREGTHNNQMKTPLEKRLKAVNICSENCLFSGCELLLNSQSV